MPPPLLISMFAPAFLANSKIDIQLIAQLLESTSSIDTNSYAKPQAIRRRSRSPDIVKKYTTLIYGKNVLGAGELESSTQGFIYTTNHTKVVNETDAEHDIVFVQGGMNVGKTSSLAFRFVVEADVLVFQCSDRYRRDVQPSVVAFGYCDVVQNATRQQFYHFYVKNKCIYTNKRQNLRLCCFDRHARMPPAGLAQSAGDIGVPERRYGVIHCNILDIPMNSDIVVAIGKAYFDEPQTESSDEESDTREANKNATLQCSKGKQRESSYMSEIREPSTGAKLLETDTARFKDITSRALDDISDRNRVDPEGIIAHSDEMNHALGGLFSPTMGPLQAPVVQNEFAIPLASGNVNLESINQYVDGAQHAPSELLSCTTADDGNTSDSASSDNNASLTSALGSTGNFASSLNSFNTQFVVYTQSEYPTQVLPPEPPHQNPEVQIQPTVSASVPTVSFTGTTSYGPSSTNNIDYSVPSTSRYGDNDIGANVNFQADVANRGSNYYSNPLNGGYSTGPYNDSAGYYS